MWDPHFTGNAESSGEVCGIDDVTIMLVSDQLVVTRVSTHVSVATAIARFKQPRISTIIRLTCEATERRKENPRVAVDGLNPHAGENGLFGDEEIKDPARSGMGRGARTAGRWPVPARRGLLHGGASAGEGIASTASLIRALDLAMHQARGQQAHN